MQGNEILNKNFTLSLHLQSSGTAEGSRILNFQFKLHIYFRLLATKIIFKYKISLTLFELFNFKCKEKLASIF